MDMANSSGIGRRALLGSVPADFEGFYRACVRYQPGARIGSTELARRYRQWIAATSSGRPLDPRLIKRAMRNIGHRHFKSNEVYYLDAVFADQAPTLPDNFPEPGAISEAVAKEMVPQIDAVLRDLSAARDLIAPFLPLTKDYGPH